MNILYGNSFFYIESTQRHQRSCEDMVSKMTEMKVDPNGEKLKTETDIAAAELKDSITDMTEKVKSKLKG
jgi:outer membrane protein assembly factor BamE (lipoprotein component of BamABCDE complex)